MLSLRLFQFACLALVLAGCTDAPTVLHDKKMASVTSNLGVVKLAAGPVPEHPWATRACKAGQREADVVACVDGVAITRDRVLAIQGAYPPGTSPRAIVNALIDEELLAHAAGKTLWGSWIQEPLTQILVSQLLQLDMERNFTPDKVTPEELKAAWAHREVRRPYDRAGAYVVTDAQIICCKGGEKDCAQAADAIKCIDDAEPIARALADMFVQEPPHSSLEMHGRVRGDPRFNRADVVDFTYFYDPSKAYTEQKGYDVMAEPFVMAVLKLKDGEVTPEPTRSAFGWHVTRLEHAAPPVHKKLEDPEVAADVRKNLVPALRDEHVEILVGELGKASGVELFLDRMDLH